MTLHYILMSGLFLSLFATLAVLVMGVYMSVLRPGKLTPLKNNQLMRARILLHGLSLILFFLVMSTRP